MPRLFAQPYDISAHGFYFETADEYYDKASRLRNSYGEPVEEFELQFIDGESIDAKLFTALGVNQCNFAAFLEAAEDWSDDDKIKVVIAVGEVGYTFDLGKASPDQFDVDLYELDSLGELAIQFVEEGIYGTIPRSSRIIWTTTPSPATWPWITVKFRLTVLGISIGTINPYSFGKSPHRRLSSWATSWGPTPAGCEPTRPASPSG